MNFNFKNISNFVGSSSSFDDDEHIKIINSIENEEKAIHIAMSNKKSQLILNQQDNLVIQNGSVPEYFFYLP